MNQVSFFEVSDNYIRFINELKYLLKHYKNTKAKYNQNEISNYILAMLVRYNL